MKNQNFPALAGSCKLREKLKTKNGQALIELAIFGSLILLLLGVLIGYGLRYSFQQQAAMQSFRKAQELAAELDGGAPRGSSSYTLIKDRHIPDPSGQFGIGQVNPIMASASISRDNRMDETADNYAGLPKMVVHFQGKVNGQLQDKKVELATAGLRDETVTMPNTMPEHEQLKQKYGLVYGDANISTWPDFEPILYQTDPVTGKQTLDPVTGQPIPLERPTFNLRIIDSCEGEIVDYSSCVRQARIIVDQDFFIQECEKGKQPGSDTDCNVIAGILIKMPWYVQGLKHNGSPFTLSDYYGGLRETGDEWDFPEIEKLFYLPVSGKHVKSMGPQPDYTQQITTDFTMTKSEDNRDSTTTDNIKWGTTTNRTIFYSDHLDKTSGVASSQSNLKTESVSTTRSDNRSITWQTPLK